MVKKYDKVRLKDGRTATIVEVLEEGVAYLADIDLPGPDWDTEEIRQEDIEEDLYLNAMKVRWKGETEFLMLTHDKVYTVLGMEKGWYRLVDDSGEDYLYPPENFEIVEE